MPRPPRLPASLRGRIFTAAEADAAGLTPAQRRGPHVVRVRHGVYRYRDTEPTFVEQLRVAQESLPDDAAVSHTTALRLHGVELGPLLPLHFSTATAAQTRQSGVTLHRRNHELTPVEIDTVMSLGPERSFVDSATILGLRDLVRAGDALVRLGHTTTTALQEFAEGSHLDGVLRAREAAALVRARVGSFRETDLRLLIATSGLPEPACNEQIVEPGVFARAPLVLRRHKIVVEHEGPRSADAEHRQKAVLRRERLEANGWTVIVVTRADVRRPATIVARVHEALVRKGYQGPAPELTARWHQVTRGT